MTRPHRRRDGADESGAAAVEFALIAPLLFAVVFGIISFGSAYSTKVTMTGGVREGARLLALGGTPVDVRVRVKETTPGLNPAISDADITIMEDCPTGSTAGSARVKASYDLPYNYIFGKGTFRIQATGVMRCGL